MKRKSSKAATPSAIDQVPLFVESEGADAFSVMMVSGPMKNVDAMAESPVIAFRQSPPIAVANFKLFVKRSGRSYPFGFGKSTSEPLIGTLV